MLNSQGVLHGIAQRANLSLHQHRVDASQFSANVPDQVPRIPFRANEQFHLKQTFLARAPKHHRSRRHIETAETRVPHDADHLNIFNLLPQRFLIRPELPHETLVHHRHLAVEFNIRLMDLAAVQQGNPQRREGTRPDIGNAEYNDVAIRRF